MRQAMDTALRTDVVEILEQTRSAFPPIGPPIAELADYAASTLASDEKQRA